MHEEHGPPYSEPRREPPREHHEEAERERAGTLAELERWLEGPMVALAVVWLALLVLELVRGSNPLFEAVGAAIWIVFVLDFLLRLVLAPKRLRYLKGNWITAASLALPAFRILRLVRPLRIVYAARAARGLRLARVVGSINRGMLALESHLGRRKAGYVLAVTLVVCFVGAAGMYALEEEAATGAGFRSYGEALWWTAMLLTTIGSEYWPKTPEGRVLALLLSVYSLGILGYLTAALASFFIGRDAADERTATGERGAIPGGTAAAIAGLEERIEALRAEVRRGTEGPTDRA